MYKYQRDDYMGFKKKFREFACDIRKKVTEIHIQTIWTYFKITNHIRRNTSYTRHYVVIRCPNLGLLERSRPHIVNETNHSKASTRKIKKYIILAACLEVIDPGDPNIDGRVGKQKRFWSFIKSLGKDNSWVAPLKDRGGKYTQIRWIEPTHLTFSNN